MAYFTEESLLLYQPNQDSMLSEAAEQDSTLFCPKSLPEQ